MKPALPRLAISLVLIVLLAACNMPKGGGTGPNTGVVATKVALTLAALTQSAPQVPLATPTLEQPTYTLIPTHLPTETLSPTNTPLSAPGVIAGSISGYPYGAVPRLAIVAFQQEAPYNRGYVITIAGQTYFTNNSSYLIPGHYQVVAYDPSGHAGGCTVIVVVVSNTTVNCDITNWGGGYPAKPSFVPNP